VFASLPASGIPLSGFRAIPMLIAASGQYLLAYELGKRLLELDDHAIGVHAEGARLTFVTLRTSLGKL
jgi:hypothetical protein